MGGNLFTSTRETFWQYSRSIVSILVRFGLDTPIRQGLLNEKDFETVHIFLLSVVEECTNDEDERV